MKRGTITTTFHEQQRVTFNCPVDGYCIDDLDALAVANTGSTISIADCYGFKRPLSVYFPTNLGGTQSRRN